MLGLELSDRAVVAISMTVTAHAHAALLAVLLFTWRQCFDRRMTMVRVTIRLSVVVQVDPIVLHPTSAVFAPAVRHV